MKRICILVLALVIPGLAVWSCATPTEDPFGGVKSGEGGGGGEGNAQGGAGGTSSGTGMGGASTTTTTTSTTTTTTTSTSATTSTTSTSSGGACDPIQCTLQCLPMGGCGECVMGGCMCKPFDQCGFDAGVPDLGLPDLGFP